MSETSPGFAGLPDLASRRLGGSVVCASDETFAEKENLIKPEPSSFAPGAYGVRGKVYDGWETRRRREPGHDDAIVRLGCAGIVHGVVVDTAHFTGNHPAEISVEAACAGGYPSPDELSRLRWHSLVGRSAALGDTANNYPVSDRRRWTHVRLSIYPDGGVARLRVHGQVVPDPAFLGGTVDLAAMENGALVVGCSDAFYSAPSQVIMPGQARLMSEGWENRRRRGPGNDYVVIRLAAAGVLRHVEVDTTCFVGNAPGWVRLSAADDRSAGAGAAWPPAGSSLDAGGGPRIRAGRPAVTAARVLAQDAAAYQDVAPEPITLVGRPGRRPALVRDPEPLTWWEVLPQRRVQPDTRHRFLVDDPRPATHLRLDVIPDGGIARLRAFGEVVAEGLAELSRRWQVTAP